MSQENEDAAIVADLQRVLAKPDLSPEAQNAIRLAILALETTDAPSTGNAPEGSLSEDVDGGTLEIEDAGEQLRRKMRKQARQSIPPTYIDTWATMTWRGHVRISLGEGFSDDDYYRMSIIMTLENAEEFALHLLKHARERQAKDAAGATIAQRVD